MKFDPKDVLRRAGASATALLIPFASAELKESDLGLHAALVAMQRNALCQHGIFGSASALDPDRETACQRAVFEAVERYALGAVGHHRERVRTLHRNDPRLVRRIQSAVNGFAYSEMVHCIAAAPSASRQGTLWVPLGDVFAPYSRKEGSAGGPSTTNGAACHRRFEDAEVAALLELIERHAVMRFWFMGQAHRMIDLSSHEARRSIAFTVMDELGYRVLALEISPFSACSVVLVFGINANGDFPALVCSAAAKTDQHSALNAALLENVQTLLGVVSQLESFERWRRSGRPLNHLDHNMFYYADPQAQPAIALLLGRLAVSEDVSCTFEGPSVSLYDELRAAGVSWTSVDITPPPITCEVSVCRVVCDGLNPLVIGDSAGPQLLLDSSTRLPLPHPFP